jgi:Pyruvate/2-oxoacid:ferredoxin oxidoreductase gamma subunit
VPIIAITKQTVGKMVYTSAVALGTLCALLPHVVPEKEMIRTIEDNAPSGTVEANLKAFRAGWEAILAATPERRDDIARENEGVIEERTVY